MKRELTPKEVIYNIDLNQAFPFNNRNNVQQYSDVYKKIQLAFGINKEGYNVYVVDTFSKDKIDDITNFIKDILKKRQKPKDICYVIYEDPRYPTGLFLSNGNGLKMKKVVEEIKELYYDSIIDFYNSSNNKDKEDILDEVYKKRSEHIGTLVDMAKEEGFDLKATTQGFVFIPLKEGEAMSEKDYDNLIQNDKDNIITRASKLKTGAEEILEELKELELDSIEKIRDILGKYLEDVMKNNRERYCNIFKDDEAALEYLEFIYKHVEESIINSYTINLEDDEGKIGEILNKFQVNVIVDNSENECPQVIFEEDPTVNNLLGNIEYENHNGVYSTDVSLITSGSILRANEGCLIIRMSSLINSPGSYFYLKKALLNKKVSYDYNRGYFEFLSLNGLKPLPINMNLKVILIGDFEIYDLLYSNDEDFKNIFPIRAHMKSTIDVDNDVIAQVVNLIFKIVDNNKLLKITEDGIKEIFKFLARKASSKSEVLVDELEIEKLLFLANNSAALDGEINAKHIIKAYYNEEHIEEEIFKMYKSKKMIINVKDNIIGSINGLSVIDLGYLSFGRPMRITCVCTKGEGRIIDVQRESNLSGKIHGKSLGILKAVLNKFFSPYERIPVNFHLSFEQTYGMVEGDSASVAEIIAIISSLSKRGIKQSIAVTGSINQFGEIQPIGGVNEKIEGFFKVCEILDTVKGKGVVIPAANKDELVLSPKVEEAVIRGDFKIYTMDDLTDAIKILIQEEGETLEELLAFMKQELNKYGK